MTMKEDSKYFLSNYVTYLKIAVAKFIIVKTPKHLSPKEYSQHIQMVLHNKQMNLSKRKNLPVVEDQENTIMDKQTSKIIESHEIKDKIGTKNKRKKGHNNNSSEKNKIKTNIIKQTSETSEGKKNQVNKCIKTKKIKKTSDNCIFRYGLPDCSTSKKKKGKENKIIGVIEPMLNNLIMEKPSKAEVFSKEYLESCSPSSLQLENKVASNNNDSLSFVNKTFKMEDTNSTAYWLNDNRASTYKTNTRHIVTNDSNQSKESVSIVNAGLNFSKNMWQNIDDQYISRDISSEIEEDLSWNNYNIEDYYRQNKGIDNDNYGDYFHKDLLNKRNAVRQLNNFTESQITVKSNFEKYNKFIYQNPGQPRNSSFSLDFINDEQNLEQIPYFKVSDGQYSIQSNLLNFEKSFDENKTSIADQAKLLSPKDQGSKDFSCEDTSEEWALWCYVDQVERALFKSMMENWNQCQKASQVLVDALGETSSSFYLRKQLTVFLEKVVSILTGPEVNSNQLLVDSEIWWSIMSKVMNVLKDVYGCEALAVDSTWICIGAFVKFSSMLTRNCTSQSKGGYSVLPEVGSHLVTMIASLISSILYWVKKGCTLSKIYQWTSSESSINSSFVNFTFSQPPSFLQSCTSDVNVSSVSKWEMEFYIAEWKMMLEKDCLMNMEKAFPFLAIQISDLLCYFEQTAPTMLSY